MGQDRVTDTTIAEAVRAWARGMYPTEAAAELLIRHGRTIYDGAPWLERHGDIVSIDPEKLQDASGAWSGGERRIVDIAVSLLGDHPVDLADAISGLDRDHLALVLAALAHAGGSHQHTDLRYDESGQVVGFGRDPLPPLFPWPAS